MSENEKQIEKYLVTRFKALGAEVRKLKFLDRRGAPDRIIMFKGKTYFVELKSPGEKLDEHQEREHDRMREVGQNVRVIDSIESIDIMIRNLRIFYEIRA